jgi:hypothetical protein
MNTRMVACALVAVVGVTGCEAKLEGSLMVNGQPFVPTACRSGEPSSFRGVDLRDANGAIVRVVQTPANVPQVMYLASEDAVAVPVGVCGQLTLRRTNTRINGVYNVEGRVNLQCAGGMNIAGAVRFENCH